MEPSAADNPVTLVIRAPNQKYDDQTVRCFLDWTVGRLKNHLARVYPSRPVSGPPLRRDRQLSPCLGCFWTPPHTTRLTNPPRVVPFPPQSPPLPCRRLQPLLPHPFSE